MLLYHTFTYSSTVLFTQFYENAMVKQDVFLLQKRGHSGIMGNLYGQHRSNQRGDVFAFRKKANCYHSCLSVWHEYVFSSVSANPENQAAPLPGSAAGASESRSLPCNQKLSADFYPPGQPHFSPLRPHKFLGKHLSVHSLGVLSASTETQAAEILEDAAAGAGHHGHGGNPTDAPAGGNLRCG